MRAHRLQKASSNTEKQPQAPEAGSVRTPALPVGVGVADTELVFVTVLALTAGAAGWFKTILPILQVTPVSSTVADKSDIV